MDYRPGTYDVFLSCPTNGAEDLIEIAREMFKKYRLKPYLAADHKRYDMPIFDKIMPQIENVRYTVGLIPNKVSTDVLEELAYAEAYTTVIRMVEKGTHIGGFTARKEYEQFTRDTFRESMENVCRFIVSHAKSAGKAGRAGPGRTNLSGGAGSTSLRPGSTSVPSGGSQHLVQEAGPSSIGGHVASSDPAPTWYADGGMYAKMAADDLSRTLGYGSTWGFIRERIRVANSTAWVLAAVDLDLGFVLSHMASFERPSVSATTCVLQMAQVTAGIPKVIEGDLLPAHAKSFQKTLRLIMGGDRGPEYVQNDGIMTWVEKYLVSALRKSCLHAPGLDLRTLERNMNHEIISHNFLQPAHMDVAPATRAGSPKFEIMRDIYDYGASGDKGFLVQLGSMINHINVTQYPERGLISMAIRDVGDGTRRKIEAILTECGFRRKNDSWTRRMRFTPSRGAGPGWYPKKTFEICNMCGRVALSMQEIVRLHGLRNNGGRIIPQPFCRECRYGVSIRRRFRRPPARSRCNPGETLDSFTCRTSRHGARPDAFNPSNDRYWSIKRGRQTRLR